MIQAGTPTLPSPQAARDRAVRLAGYQKQCLRERQEIAGRLNEIQQYLALAPKVEQSLNLLSQKIFEQRVTILQDKLTLALQEVLEQPIKLRADTGFSRGSVTIDFYIERGGHHEDIMRGQGGSVANVLSVGLRMFALATLDPEQHRPFLVLDEQDCWLQPDLVPKLVKIIYDASRALGFQVLLISHHDTSHFAAYADKIYRFELSSEGICHVALEQQHPKVKDGE